MLKNIFVGISLCALSGVASATLVDFEDLGVAAGTQLNPAPGVGIISGGFNFDPGPITTSLNDLHFHNQNGIGNNGTTHLGTHDDVIMSILLGTFSIQSFDFEGFITESDITVVGSFSGGGTISTTFMADLDPNTYETFNFSNAWSNLVSVAFNYNGNGDNGFFLDNIEVNNANVPEPSVLALLSLGLIGIGFSRRK